MATERGFEPPVPVLASTTVYETLKQLQHGAVDPFVPDLNCFERRTTTFLLQRLLVRLRLLLCRAVRRDSVRSGRSWWHFEANKEKEHGHATLSMPAGRSLPPSHSLVITSWNGSENDSEIAVPLW
jgi:hypothetical protein